MAGSLTGFTNVASVARDTETEEKKKSYTLYQVTNNKTAIVHQTKSGMMHSKCHRVKLYLLQMMAADSENARTRWTAAFLNDSDDTRLHGEDLTKNPAEHKQLVTTTTRSSIMFSCDKKS